MKVSVGTDIEETARFAALASEKPRLLKRIFSVSELAYCASKGAGEAQSLAARYCAKEAFAKAVGVGLSPKLLRCVEVAADGAGAPRIELSGEFAEKYGARTITLSISHTAEYAVATVLAIDEADEDV